jgi:hypothetical protein
MSINRDTFPIELEGKNKTKEYEALLRFLAINEMFIEQIDELTEFKAIFKHKFKAKANDLKMIAEDVSAKMFCSKAIMDDYDLLYKEVISECKNILNTIKVIE